MRRRSIDFSYKQRTSDIIRSVYEPWQLTYRDAREGVHRLVNTVVSVSDEFDNEIKAIENLFFIDHIDIGEEHVLYRTLSVMPASGLFLSGVPVSGIVRPALNVDDLVSGEFDVLLSGEIPLTPLPVSGISDIIGIHTDQIVYLCDSGIIAFNPRTGQEIYRLPSSIIPLASGEIILDVNNPIGLIEEEFEESTLQVYKDGSAIPYTLTSSFVEGYEQELDIDSNGVIWLPEAARLSEIAGKSIAVYGVDTWHVASWADLDQDGTIGAMDVASVRSLIPSARPGVFGAFTIPSSSYGKVVYTYERKVPRPLLLVRNGSEYRTIISSSALAEEYTDIAYDEHTDVYYGIRSTLEVDALRYMSEHDSIISRIPLHVELWHHECEIIDLDTAHGYLFLLVRGPSEYRVLYTDIWKEYVEEVELSSRVEIPLGFEPCHLSCTDDGHILLSDGYSYLMLKPTRDRYLEIGDHVYFNLRHGVRDVSGTPVRLVPHFLFNNFDSYAFSLGVERAPGCNNVQLRALVHDFYVREQGTSAIGMAHGVHRELGYTGKRVVPSGHYVTLPFTLADGFPCVINGETVSGIPSPLSGSLFFSGEFGSFDVVGGRLLCPYYDTLSVHSLHCEFNALDGNQDVIECEYDLTLGDYTQEMPIGVWSLQDRLFLEREGLVVDGVETPALVSLVRSLESSSPSLVRNVVIDQSVAAPLVVPDDILVPTRFGPLSGELVIPESDMVGVL